MRAARRARASSTGSRTSSRTSHASTTSSTRPTALSRAAIGALFRDGCDPLEVIKWRDLYRELENTIDAAEDAAEAIERMFHKAT